MSFALDTNAVIHLLNGKPTSVKEHFNHTIESGELIFIPPFVDYEIMRGFYYSEQATKLATYEKLRSLCPVGEMNSATWECAARVYATLRRANSQIGDGDICISAYCIINDYVLVTQNTKHFENIEDLHIVNWAQS